MIDPPRLLDDGNDDLGSRLLRSAERDRPSPAATRRAMRVAASAASVAGLGVAAAAASSSGALVKGVITWLVIGGLGGTVVSVGARQLIEPGTDRKQQAARSRVHDDTRPTSVSVRSPEPETAAATTEVPALEIPAPAQAASAARALALPSGHRASDSQQRASTPELAPSPRARSEASPPNPPSPPRPSVVHSGVSSAAGSTPSMERPGFADEVTLIDRARQRLSSGDAISTLSLLSAYQAAFPGGHFLPEALALRVEALAAAGRATNARQAAERFLSEYPGHPLSARVRAVMERLPAAASR
jgi:hypothetical protein